MVEYEVLIEEDEDGGFVIECTSLPGCHTQGETIEEALENIKELIPLCEEARQDPSPSSTLRSTRPAIKTRRPLRFEGKIVIAA